MSLDLLSTATQGFARYYQASSNAKATMRQAEAAALQHRASAAAHEANANIAGSNAQASITSGETARARQEQIGRTRIEAKTSSFLSSGVTLSGSALDVIGQEAVQEALITDDVFFQKEVQAFQFENEANLQRFYAGQSQQQSARVLAAGRSAASDIQTGGLIGAGTSLLSAGLRKLGESKNNG